jgi:hypothetical protein
MDVQLRVQLAKVARLKRQLKQQTELEEQLHCLCPFQVQEDMRETELIERVNKFNKETRERLDGEAGRVTSQPPGDSRQASTRGSSRIAQAERRNAIAARAKTVRTKTHRNVVAIVGTMTKPVSYDVYSYSFLSA